MESITEKRKPDPIRESVLMDSLTGHDGLISDQRLDTERRKGTLGVNGNVHDNGCGAIAIYNALKLLGHNPDFLKLLELVRAKWLWACLAGGKMGVSPLFIQGYMKRQGVKVSWHFFHPDKKGVKVQAASVVPSGQKQVLIISYLYQTKRGMGAHYQAGYLDDDGYLRTYNDDICDEDGLAGFYRRKKREEDLTVMAVLR